MHTSIDELFDGLWQDYLSITPSAHKIHKLLENHCIDSFDNNDNPQSNNRPRSIINDHIALRTFDLEKTALPNLAEHFLNLGYEQKGEYDFKAKKLSALHFEHEDTNAPKVFISQLRTNELSQQSQRIIHKLVDQMEVKAPQNSHFLYSGTHWEATSDDYYNLLKESEYAAWMCAWGFRANHFTVSVNHLDNLDDSPMSKLEQVNNLLKNAGFKLNTSGGEIKGGSEVYLAQSSTMADTGEVKFTDKIVEVPSCFYEFAQRFVLPNGKLYTGFVAASADKIFESTNAS